MPQSSPIVYESSVQVRFSDLDPNGHVNAAAYFDYVLSGRWYFLKKRFGMTPGDLVARGLSFFITHVETDFRQSITGAQSVHIRSWIEKFHGARFTARYEILHSDDGTMYAQGCFDFAAIDPVSGRAIRIPEWVMEYFFENEDEP